MISLVSWPFSLLAHSRAIHIDPMTRVIKIAVHSSYRNWCVGSSLATNPKHFWADFLPRQYLKYAWPHQCSTKQPMYCLQALNSTFIILSGFHSTISKMLKFAKIVNRFLAVIKCIKYQWRSLICGNSSDAKSIGSSHLYVSTFVYIGIKCF